MTTKIKVRIGKGTSVGGVPKSGCPSVSQRSAAAVDHERSGQRTSSGVHSDLERQLAVFTDFWFAAVRYQILKGFSDNHLACEVLGVSDKTIGNWRSCIAASGVVVELIALIDGLPAEMRSGNTAKIKKSLLVRLDELKEPRVITGKKVAGLPSGQTFEEAVKRSTHTVLVSLVMDLDARASSLAGVCTPGQKSQSVAEHLGAELIDLFRAAEGLDLPMYRGELESRLVKVSQISSRLSLHKALSIGDLFHDDHAELFNALAVAVQEAKDEARSYVSKLYRRMEIDNQFSERATFRARLSSKEPLYRIRSESDPTDPFHPDNFAAAKAAELDRLGRLIDAHAETREP